MLHKQLESDDYIKISSAQELFVKLTGKGKIFIANGGYHQKPKDKIERREES